MKLEELHKFEGHNLGVVGLTAHGDMAASVGLDCSIRLWDLKDGSELKCIDGGPADAWSISFSPDGSKLATGANGGNVRVSHSYPKFSFNYRGDHNIDGILDVKSRNFEDLDF